MTLDVARDGLCLNSMDVTRDGQCNMLNSNSMDVARNGEFFEYHGCSQGWTISKIAWM